jgi:hypothetical protein
MGALVLSGDDLNAGIDGFALQRLIESRKRDFLP